MQGITRPLIGGFVAMIAAVALFAGCGGDDETTSSTSTTESTEAEAGATGATGAAGSADAEVVAQINELCTQTYEDLEGSDQDPVDAANDLLDQIREVPGAEDDPNIAAFIEASQAQIDAQDTGGPEAEAAEAAAEAAGLDDCVPDSAP